MIADLPMYARPEIRPALDALWALIREGLRARGLAAPERLAHADGCASLWTRGDVVLGEACNLPMRTGLKGRVTLVGSCDHGLDGVPPGCYDSVFVRRPGGASPDEAAREGVPLAYNGPDSHSGWAGPQIWAMRRALPFFRAGIATGSHRASARAVAEGRADLAALDRVTWTLMERHEPDLAARLEVAGRTDPAPGMSLITSAQDPAPHRAAVEEALRALAPAHAALLTLRAVVDLPADAWDLPAVPAPEDLAAPA